jgi:cell division septation protein DedD
MLRWVVLLSVSVICASTEMRAQAASRPTDPVFVRAQALVSDGNGVAGRALIDSVIAATPSGARLYPEALFWRASLAASAADAESDYRHIVVDYPLAPQAEDALLRLAQLELARGDRDGALIHLQRIQRDYPRSRSLARASYWTARVLFEKNDIANACAANAKALAQTDSGEIELRNQIQYQGQRCPSVATISSTPAAASETPANANSQPASPPIAVNPPTSPVASSTPATVERDKGRPGTPDTTLPKVSAPAAVAPVSTPTLPRPTPPAQANDAKPSIVDPARAPRAGAERVAATKPAMAAANATKTGGYSVQVGAYNHKIDAEKLVSTLTKRAYAARVDGSVAPFRVRIGHYATENEAEDALKQIKAKRMDGFVVRAPER